MNKFLLPNDDALRLLVCECASTWSSSLCHIMQTAISFYGKYISHWEKYRRMQTREKKIQENLCHVHKSVHISMYIFVTLIILFAFEVTDNNSLYIYFLQVCLCMRVFLIFFFLTWFWNIQLFPNVNYYISISKRYWIFWFTKTHSIANLCLRIIQSYKHIAFEIKLIFFYDWNNKLQWLWHWIIVSLLCPATNPIQCFILVLRHLRIHFDGKKIRIRWR